MITEDKVKTAISRIEKAYENFGTSLFCGHSGGKDSVVIFDLAQKVYPKITVIHNSKSNTHPDTVKFLYGVSEKHNVLFVPPSNMERAIKTYGLRCQIDGTRIAECSRTDGRSTDFVVDNKNVSREVMTEFVENGLYGMGMLYPIYDWTDEEVWEYISVNNLSISNEYSLGA